MTTIRKILLAILVAVLVFDASIYWRAHNKVNNTVAGANDINKEMDGLIKNSYHDGGYENSWVQDIDPKEGVVLVTTIDTKMNIIFKPVAGDIQKFHIGWIAPVTFQCTKLKKEKCDFESPYKLFVSNGLVEVTRLILPKK